jgi:hypothetical protein
MTVGFEVSMGELVSNAKAIPVVEGGGPGRIRTCDTRFRKPLLYPLSYGAGRSTVQQSMPGQ